MFFSIIIPTYNPKPFLPRLLDSIVHNECLDDIEVIISDDCSDEPFDDILKRYTNLNIRVISNEQHHGFPRNGRQHGSEEAKGKWFCFSDQDDYFVDGAFDAIKKYIIENDTKNYLITNFIMEDSTTGEQHVEDAGKGWTHGKFYEAEFWRKYNICYDEIDYCEDINLSTKISCLMSAEKLVYTKVDTPVYIWCRRKDSLSDISYFVKSFPDYIRATLGVVLDYLEKYKDDKELNNTYQVLFFQTFLHMYFYLQSPFFYSKKKTVLEIILILQPIYERFKQLFDYTNDTVIHIMGNELLSAYNDTRYTDFKQIPFIEQMTFKDWLSAYFD